MQKILVSIDVEAPTGDNPISSLIYGETKKGQYGVPLIINTLDEFGIKGLFFVDIAESWDYSLDKICDLIRYITNRGHNVGVHIHPDHMMDINRRNLWEYSFDEQYEMIKKCYDIFIEAVGIPPFSFRAGRYSVNDDTIKVLELLGFKMDMSAFYGKKNCKLTNFASFNQIWEISDNLYEVPVTSFRSIKIGKYEKYNKIDVSNSFLEFKTVMKKIIGTDNVHIVSYFLHSFSFLRWRKNPNRPSFYKKEYKKFRRELIWMKKNQCLFIAEKDVLTAQYCVDNTRGFIDNSRNILSLVFFIKRLCRIVYERTTRNI